MSKTVTGAAKLPQSNTVVFVSSLVFLTVAMTLAVPSGYSYGPALLCLAGVVLLFKERIWTVLEPEDWWLVGAFAFYFVVNAGSHIYHGYPGSPTTNSNRFLLGALILPVLLKYPPRPLFLWAGLVVGCVSGFGVAVWQTSVAGLSRAHGFINPIQFGDFCILMGFLCLVSLIWAHQTHQPGRRKAALIVGAVAGIGASLLSSSRGGWLLIPILPIVFGWLFRRQLSLKTLVLPVLGAIAVFAVLVALPTTHIEKRVTTATDQLALFMNGEGATSSVGVRLTMWVNAAKIIVEKPVLGWGELGYEAAVLSHVDRANVRSAISGFDHLHNGIIDATAKRGLIGLAALLSIYLVPLILFWRKLRQSRANPFMLGGFVTVLAMFVFGWTETMFMHSSSNILYVFYIIVFWSCARDRCVSIA